MWADQILMQSVNHINFKLSDSENVLLVHSDGVRVLDSLSYLDVNDDQVFNGYPHEAGSVLIYDKPFPMLDNLECSIVSVSNTKIVVNLHFYPNPAAGILNIVGEIVKSVKVFNTFGKLVRVVNGGFNFVDTVL